ncbi:peptide deformylase [Streptomyces lydicus]|uniref:peptide deformylase n=1 Tax=Streptomyces lydicus TaxID=47763 RepID=UPI0037A0E135
MRDEAERVVDALFAAMERIGQVHPFAKGMGIAAPQIGIGRAAAVVRPPGKAPAVILLNPRITTRSDETDEQYEGCLSFFDVRGLIPRPLTIKVETTARTGETVTTVYERGLARLVHQSSTLRLQPAPVRCRGGLAAPSRRAMQQVRHPVSVGPNSAGRTGLRPPPCRLQAGSTVTHRVRGAEHLDVGFL